MVSSRLLYVYIGSSLTSRPDFEVLIPPKVSKNDQCPTYLSILSLLT